jgi:methionine synthase II (cobalamin-independent)
MDAFYADVTRVYNEEIADLAGAGCRYLQVDDVNFAYICDPRVSEQVRRMGEDPDKLPHTYARLINAAIAKRPEDMTVGLHVCRGNAPSGWTEGSYEPVADILFNEIDVSAYFLEYDSPRAGGFEPLRFLPKGKTVVLGLVSTKTTRLEDKDALKRRIDEAARHVPLDQLAISTQCGFSSGMTSAGVRGMTEADEMAKLRLVVEVAREVWG